MGVNALAKCVKKGEQVRRVSDKDAAVLVAKEGWQYIPKSEYKRLKNQ